MRDIRNNLELGDREINRPVECIELRPVECIERWDEVDADDTRLPLKLATWGLLAMLFVLLALTCIMIV